MLLIRPCIDVLTTIWLNIIDVNNQIMFIKKFQMNNEQYFI
jgi:hypothetical protein